MCTKLVASWCLLVHQAIILAGGRGNILCTLTFSHRTVQERCFGKWCVKDCLHLEMGVHHFILAVHSRAVGSAEEMLTVHQLAKLVREPGREENAVHILVPGMELGRVHLYFLVPVKNISWCRWFTCKDFTVLHGCPSSWLQVHESGESPPSQVLALIGRYCAHGVTVLAPFSLCTRGEVVHQGLAPFTVHYGALGGLCTFMIVAPSDFVHQGPLHLAACAVEEFIIGCPLRVAAGGIGGTKICGGPSGWPFARIRAPS